MPLFRAQEQKVEKNVRRLGFCPDNSWEDEEDEEEDDEEPLFFLKPPI